MTQRPARRIEPRTPDRRPPKPPGFAGDPPTTTFAARARGAARSPVMPSVPPERVTPVRALTSDLWFTVIYLRPKDQRTIERSRLKVWSDPLVAGGRSRSGALRDASRLESWAARAEGMGRTPTIAAQASWLSRSTRIRVRAAEIERALDHLAYSADTRVAPGAVAALEQLRSGGIRLGVVSNVLHETPDGLRRVLRRLGLLSLFETLVLSSEHPWSKPRPEPFHRALDSLGVPPESAAHIGDLEYDVTGAQRAGVRPYLYTGLHRFEPERLGRLVTGIDPAVPRVTRWRALPCQLRRLA